MCVHDVEKWEFVVVLIFNVYTSDTVVIFVIFLVS